MKPLYHVNKALQKWEEDNYQRLMQRKVQSARSTFKQGGSSAQSKGTAATADASRKQQQQQQWTPGAGWSCADTQQTMQQAPAQSSIEGLNRDRQQESHATAAGQHTPPAAQSKHKQRVSHRPEGTKNAGGTPATQAAKSRLHTQRHQTSKAAAARPAWDESWWRPEGAEAAGGTHQQQTSRRSTLTSAGSGGGSAVHSKASASGGGAESGGVGHTRKLKSASQKESTVAAAPKGQRMTSSKPPAAAKQKPQASHVGGSRATTLCQMQQQKKRHATTAAARPGRAVVVTKPPRVAVAWWTAPAGADAVRSAASRTAAKGGTRPHLMKQLAAATRVPDQLVQRCSQIAAQTKATAAAALPPSEQPQQCSRRQCSPSHQSTVIETGAEEEQQVVTAAAAATAQLPTERTLPDLWEMMQQSGFDNLPPSQLLIG